MQTKEMELGALIFTSEYLMPAPPINAYCQVPITAIQLIPFFYRLLSSAGGTHGTASWLLLLIFHVMATDADNSSHTS